MRRVRTKMLQKGFQDRCKGGLADPCASVSMELTSTGYAQHLSFCRWETSELSHIPSTLQEGVLRYI